MIKLVVFDMAGTTVDEQNVVYKTLHKAIDEAGFDISFKEVLRDGAGKEKKRAIIDILEDFTSENLVIDSIFDRFLVLLDEAYKNLDVIPQDGAEAIFNYLKSKDIKVVLNTGYDQATAELLIQKLKWQLGVHYDLLVTASQVSKSRPHPDMIQLAQQTLGIEDPQSVIKVGDSIIDIEEGKNAGCKYNIGITTGAHTEEQLQSAKPDYIIHHLSELQAIIA